MEAPTEEKHEELTLDVLLKNIQDHAVESIAESTCQIEENPEFVRLHIYTNDKRKFGVVKIQKSDLSLQLRKLINGKPEIYDSKSFDELKQYIKL